MKLINGYFCLATCFHSFVAIYSKEVLAYTHAIINVSIHNGLSAPAEIRKPFNKKKYCCRWHPIRRLFSHQMTFQAWEIELKKLRTTAIVLAWELLRGNIKAIKLCLVNTLQKVSVLELLSGLMQVNEHTDAILFGNHIIK